MKKTIFYILLLTLICSCKSDNSLDRFLECYPQQNYTQVKKAIDILDLAIKEKYPDNNLANSYKKLSEVWIKDANHFNQILTKEQIKECEMIIKENKLLDDFYLKNEHGYIQVNYWGNYFKCLSQMESERIKNWCKMLEASGDFMGPGMILSEISQIDENVDELEFFMMRLELILKIIPRPTT